MPALERFTESSAALVFGASGGIGAALAAELVEHPRFARVLGTARDPARVPEGVEGVALDVTDDTAIAEAATAIRARTDRLDLVLYCIGILHDDDRRMSPEKRLADVERANLEHAFAVNAYAPLLLAPRLVSLLPRSAHCVWGNFSARVGSIGDDRMGGWYAYRASKAAQNMITRNMAIELGRRHRGLACVALHPGTVATSLSAPFRSAENEGVMEPGEAAARLLEVIDGLDTSATGRFFAWDGEELPW